MKTLALTSPLMQGPNVRSAQTLLARGGYYEGAIDGVYGPVTAGSAREAKYQLGYAQKNLTDVYGPALHAYLNGSAMTGPLMRSRALTRRKLDDTAGEQHAAEALTMIGLVEQPAGSNRVAGVTDWYGIVGPWCAMGQTRAGVNAGLGDTFARGSRYAYCPYVVRDAEQGVHGLRSVHRFETVIVPGLLCLFDWDDDRVADHIGATVTEAFVDRHAPDLMAAARQEHRDVLGRDDLRHGEFWCAEMNTAFGNDSNGGRAMLRIRRRDDLRALVRITRR